MGLAVNPEDDLDVRRRKADQRFFNERTLILLQVFRGKGIGHADNELIILVAQADGLAEPGAVIRFADLDL